MRGFTLYEALVTLTLAGLVLAVSGQILTGYGRLARQSHTRGQTREAAAQAVRTLASQLREAADWQEPAPGASSPRLRYTRYSLAVPAWLATCDGPAWNARAAGQPRPVLVELSGTTLRLGDQVLALDVKTFAAVRSGDERLDLTVTVNDQLLTATAERMLR